MSPSDFERKSAHWLRSWAATFSDADLSRKITEWERWQTEAGAGLARVEANRRLRYLRAEYKHRNGL